MAGQDEKVLESYLRGDSGDQEVRAALSTFKGQRYFSLRTWYQPEQGDRLPSKNGINLPIDEWPKFKELVDALDAELGRKD